MEQRFKTFTVLINRISRNIRKIKNQEMAEYNIRSVHVSCLYFIYRAKKSHQPNCAKNAKKMRNAWLIF